MHPVLTELPDDVRHPAVTQVGDVLIESKPENTDPRALHWQVGIYEHLNEFLCDELTHPVVDSPSCEDDLWLVSQLLGPGGEVVGVNADAVAPHQARREGEEVPLCPGCGEHVCGTDAEPVADHGDLVH